MQIINCWYTPGSFQWHGWQQTCWQLLWAKWVCLGWWGCCHQRNYQTPNSQWEQQGSSTRPQLNMLLAPPSTWDLLMASLGRKGWLLESPTPRCVQRRQKQHLLRHWKNWKRFLLKCWLCSHTQQPHLRDYELFCPRKPPMQWLSSCIYTSFHSHMLSSWLEIPR